MHYKSFQLQDVSGGGGEVRETGGGLRYARHERLEGAHQLGFHEKGTSGYDFHQTIKGYLTFGSYSYFMRFLVPDIMNNSP